MRKGFTLLEVITAIGIMVLVISALLLVVYNIQLLQSRKIWGQTVAKKAEFYILTNFLGVKEEYMPFDDILDDFIYNVIIQKFNNDQDLKEIQLKNCSFSQFSRSDLYVNNVVLYGSNHDKNNSNNNNIRKFYFKVEIDYSIRSTKQDDKVEFIVPLIMVHDLGPDSYEDEDEGGEDLSGKTSY